MKQDFIISEGLRIDLEEGWKKIISRQFGGNPGKGFGELIQNFLDSYSAETPWDERMGIITTGSGWISIKDYGSGLSLEKIKLVTRMGGTDKASDASKIGKFGIGFFSIFNPKLKTRKVEITTKCEGEPIRLEYIITKDGERPLLNSQVLDRPIDFSTEVKVYFDDPDSVSKCIEYGKESLRYYPCNVKINGKRFSSIWEEASHTGAHLFNKDHCNGLIKPGINFMSTILLCKYEHISEMPIRFLITGGHSIHHNLNDFARTQTPYMPDLEFVVNCNDLSVTISRDAFYLDGNFRRMVKDLNEGLIELMDQHYKDLSQEMTLANMYILRNQLSKYWGKRPEQPGDLSPSEALFERFLNARVFAINGKKNLHSLLEIKALKSPDIPLFFSEKKTKLRWLGGAFKHDFIVLPTPCKVGGSAPQLYDQLFTKLFDDVVNLDTISSQRSRIKSLIEKGIIRKESLEISCDFMEPRVLSKKEALLLKKLERLLNREDVLRVIERSIGIPVKAIHPAFFLLKNGGIQISTGIFDDQQKPINEDFISNFLKQKREEESAEAEEAEDLKRLSRDNTMLLGLSLNHPFVRSLIESDDPQREYFALTYIASELTNCQRLLSPYSNFYKMVKARLTSDIRKCMIDELTEAV